MRLQLLLVQNPVIVYYQSKPLQQNLPIPCQNSVIWTLLALFIPTSNCTLMYTTNKTKTLSSSCAIRKKLSFFLLNCLNAD